MAARIAEGRQGWGVAPGFVLSFCVLLVLGVEALQPAAMARQDAAVSGTLSDAEASTATWARFESRLRALEERERITATEGSESGQRTELGATREVAVTGSRDAAAAADDRWTVRLGGHIQADYVLWPEIDPAVTGAQNYFNFRRLRLVADGKGYGQFDFRLQMTLEPGVGLSENQFATPDVKDAYLSMNDIPGIGRVRIGNFFVPFSLEQVTNDTNNIFNERSIPSQGVFAVDREIGIAVYNKTESENVSWTTGIFLEDINDTVKTRLDANQGYRLAGRLVWVPYYDEASQGRYLVHTGLGVLHTHTHNDIARFRVRPQIQRGPVLIDSGPLAADSYTTGGAEFAVVWGPVTLQSEAFVSQVNLLAGPAAHVGGAYAHISYFLTGENRQYERFGQHGAQFGRNVPAVNFYANRQGRGTGAWEVKARWSYLDLTDVQSGQYNDLSTGFNWYWSDRTRIMFDWIRPMTDSQTLFGSTESDILALRLDVNW